MIEYIIVFYGSILTTTRFEEDFHHVKTYLRLDAVRVDAGSLPCILCDQ